MCQLMYAMETKLTDEQKKEVAEAVKTGIKDGVDATRGKNLSWWERALWIAGLAAAYLAQAFLGSGCQYMTPEQVLQVSEITHETYHIVTGKNCILLVEDCGK